MYHRSWFQSGTASAELRLPLLLAAALAAAVLAGPGSAFATCPAGAGVAGVDVALIDLDADSTADVNTNDKERNEHARISSSLAAKLGVTVAAGADVFPQIRVVVDNEPLPNGEKGTGVFSVFEVFADAADRVEVWANEDSSDTRSGYFRLFETTAVSDFSAVDVTVYAQAPSETTTTVDGGAPSVVEHFCEPHAHAFTEEVHISSEKTFALLVPHGGDIEPRTGEQVPTISSTLSGIWYVHASTWETGGTWFGGDHESEHWHITSKDTGDSGFPGLADLLDEPPFDGQRAFQYVASLHGMKFSKEGLVIGGRAHREAKCLIASRIRERLAAEGEDLPAVYVWNYDKDLAESIEVAHTDGTLITGERGSNPGLSGTSSSNVVNRLSPNADGAAGYGGIQIEQSLSLRADGYRDLVAEEIAHAFGELLIKPGVIDPSSTAMCDALVAGDPAPTAEIRGLVWWDDDGDDAQDGTDDGVAGMELELLDAAGSVVATTLTDGTGHYSFPHLVDGAYRVRVAASPVFAFAAQDAVPGDDTLDSDPSPSTKTTDPITLTPHQIVYDVDAGLRLDSGTARIGDRVWLDDGTADAVQTAGEGGVAGVQVELFDADGVLLATRLTDGGGYYLFDALPAGSYALRFATDPGYVAVAAGQGSDPSLDSDLDASGTVAVTLSAGASDLDIDAGYRVGCHDATLVAFGSEWKTSTSSASGWNETSFNDLAWTESLASLGYGTSPETSFSTTGSVTYFRLSFEVEDETVFGDLGLTLVRNDGAVVYLNGTQVLSSNVPTATSSQATVTQTISGSLLNEGTNVLAVAVHEHDDDATLLFDLELSATICDPCVASVSIPLDRGTYLREGSGAGHGDESLIEMDGSSEKNGLFAWDVSVLPTDAEVLHAEIELVVDNKSSDPFRLYPAATEWNEADADWYHATETPAVTSWAAAGANDDEDDYEGAEPLAVMRFNSGTTPFTGYVVLNVSGRELVQSWVRGERANDGILVPGEFGSDGLDVLSDDSAAPPLLHLVYRGCGE